LGGIGARDELVAELFAIAERVGDPGLRLQACHAAWSDTLWLGKVSISHEHIQEGIALYDHDAHRNHALLYGAHDPAVCGWGHEALATWLLGYPEQAIHSVRQAGAVAESLNHAPSMGHALWFAGMTYQMRHDAAEALACGEHLVALGDEHDLGQYRAIGGIMRGWARACGGEPETGIAEFRKSLCAYRAGTDAGMDFFLSTLADTELHLGNLDSAMATLGEALAKSNSSSRKFWRADILRVKGDLLWSRLPNDPDAAVRCYREALAIARTQQAKSLELRAATSLARLLSRQGHRTEARELIAPLYAWFNEGFDTADLKEAKTLLDELA
jgi:predicted ATPase